MKKLYRSATLIVTLFMVFQSQAQKQANVWYFGEKFGLNFNTVPPTVLTNGSNTSSSGEGEGTSSICDANGNLLLYSDGIRIYRGDGTTITSVNSNYNISQNIFVPDPANANQYYFIYPWAINTTTNDVQGIQYTKLSATSTTNGALVGAANQTLTTTGVTQGLTVIPDASNGYWLVSHTNATNSFIVWHLTNSGFSAPVTYNVGFAAPGGTAIVSMMKTNSCFNQIAVTYFNSSKVQILDFNNATGAITTVLYDITNFENGQTYGVEFSPSGNVLYVSLNGEGTSGAGCRLYQFDLTVGGANINLAGSRYTLDNSGPGGAVNRYGAVQLGPDGNVYMTMHADWGNNGGGVSVVNNPDVFGAGAGYSRLVYKNTNGGISSWPAEGLPPVLRNFLSGTADFGSNLPLVSGNLFVCSGTPTSFNVSFTGSYAPGTATVNWNYPSGANVLLSGTPATISNTYALAGNYTAQLGFRDVCNRVYTVRKTITVTTVVTSGNVSCSSSPAVVTLTGLGSGSANYIWSQANKSVIGVGASLVKSYPTSTAIPAFFTVLDASTIGSNITAGPTNYAGTGDYDASGGNTSSFSIFQNTVLDAVSVRKAANFTDGSVNPRAGIIAVMQGGTVVAMKSVNINTDQNVGVITTFSNLGLYIPAGTGYTLSITSFSSAYNPTNAPVNLLSLASFSGAASPFYNYQFKQISPCSNVITVTGICVLSVKYVSFQAEEQDKQILLHWSTSEERNNMEFVIERSANGYNFEVIGKVSGNGNVNHHTPYSFIDKNPVTGVSYYRLKQVDFDGNYAHSSIVQVSRDVLDLVQLQPNPFRDAITITIRSSADAAQAELKIYNIHGALIQQTTVDTDQSLQIGQNLAPGMYLLEVLTNGNSVTHKIIKE